MLRNLPLLLLVVVLAAAVVAGVGWLQATRLPEWYLSAEDGNGIGVAGRESGIEISLEIPKTSSPGAVDGGGSLQGLLERGRAILDGLRAGRQIELDERELELFLVGHLTTDPRGREILRHARAVRATIDNGAVEVGAVVDPSAVPPETWPREAWGLLRPLAKSVPGDGDKSLYVAMRSVPTAREGKLVLDRRTTLLVGDLAIRAAWLADRVDGLGWNDGLEVDLGSVYLDDVRVLEHTVLVTLSGTGF